MKTTKDFHDLFMNLDQDKFEKVFFNGNEGKKWLGEEDVNRIIMDFDKWLDNECFDGNLHLTLKESINIKKKVEELLKMDKGGNNDRKN